MKKLILSLLLLGTPLPASALVPDDTIIDILKSSERHFKHAVILSGAMSLAYLGTWYWSHRCTHQIKKEKKLEDNTKQANKARLQKQLWWANKANTLSGFLATIGTTTTVLTAYAFVKARNNINTAAEEINAIVKQLNAITLF